MQHVPQRAWRGAWIPAAVRSRGAPRLRLCPRNRRTSSCDICSTPACRCCGAVLKSARTRSMLVPCGLALRLPKTLPIFTVYELTNLRKYSASSPGLGIRALCRRPSCLPYQDLVSGRGSRDSSSSSTLVTPCTGRLRGLRCYAEQPILGVQIAHAQERVEHLKPRSSARALFCMETQPRSSKRCSIHHHLEPV